MSVGNPRGTAGRVAPAPPTTTRPSDEASLRTSPFRSISLKQPCRTEGTEATEEIAADEAVEVGEAVEVTMTEIVGEEDEGEGEEVAEAKVRLLVTICLLSVVLPLTESLGEWFW